jgi:polar amino acid transport system substrate-binding protein
MKKLSLLFCAFLLVFCAVTFAAAGPVIDSVLKKGELVVGTSGDYPPLTAKTKDGKLIGLDVDLATLIALSMDVKPKIVQMQFSELLGALETGKIDMIISAMTITPKRNLKFAYVGPYFVSGQSILTTRETALKADSLNDINKPDFTLAVPAGTTSEMVVKNNVTKAKTTVTKNMDEAVKLLLAGKVKAVMSDSAASAVASFRYRDKGIIATSPLTFEALGIAIPATDPLLVNWLENFLTSLRGSGELELLVNKWFKNSSWMKDLP